MKSVLAVVTVLVLGWGGGAFAIINGVPVEGAQYEELVHVLGSGQQNCDGVLIGPRVVATAAHCVRNSKTAMVTTFDGQKAMVHFTTSPLYPSKNHDLALGVLPEHFHHIESGWVADRPAALGEALTMVGDGCSTVERPSDGHPRAGEAAVIEFQQFDFQTGGPSAAQACYGDSGAPGFRGEGDDRVVLGLLTMGNLTTATYLVRFDVAESQQLMHTFSQANGVEICGFEGGCGDDGKLPATIARAR